MSLKKEFESHVDSIITLQRYVRGFLVRLRMWREALRAEEELWGVVEIQRMWRGYVGRNAWVEHYEKMWCREIAAARMQRHIRAWLSRSRVNKMKRKLARHEFEQARMRYKSAQKIQSLARGVLVRKIIRAWRERIIASVIRIQRVARGHSLRRKLWDQVLNQRSTMIGAVMRGYLVRKRRFHLIAKVIMIQQNWRHVKGEGKELRKRRYVHMQQRKEAAKVIQNKYKKHQEKKEIARIAVQA